MAAAAGRTEADGFGVQFGIYAADQALAGLGGQQLGRERHRQPQQVAPDEPADQPRHALPMCAVVGNGNSNAGNVIAMAITASEK